MGCKEKGLNRSTARIFVMDLSEIGLSSYEQQAYETLVMHGKLSASDISRESGVSYGKIYEVLARLETKGLVRIIPEKTKKFAPTDPKHLLDMIEKKKKQLDELESSVGELKKIYVENKEEPVLIARGLKAWPKVRDALKKGKEFVYSVKWSVEYTPKAPRRKQNMQEGINFKTLARVAPSTKENLKKWLKLDKEHKVVDNKGVAMNITEDEVLFVLVNQNTSVVIRDVAVATLLKEMFESLYEKKDYITSELLETV